MARKGDGNPTKFPFYCTPYGGQNAWCRAAHGYYLGFIAAGKTHDRAELLAIKEADADEAEDLLEKPQMVRRPLRFYIA
jgi:hypothetical protein